MFKCLGNFSSFGALITKGYIIAGDRYIDQPIFV